MTPGMDAPPSVERDERAVGNFRAIGVPLRRSSRIKRKSRARRRIARHHLRPVRGDARVPEHAEDHTTPGDSQTPGRAPFFEGDSLPALLRCMRCRGDRTSRDAQFRREAWASVASAARRRPSPPEPHQGAPGREARIRLPESLLEARAACFVRRMASAQIDAWRRGRRPASSSSVSSPAATASTASRDTCRSAVSRAPARR